MATTVNKKHTGEAGRARREEREDSEWRYEEHTSEKSERHK